MSALAAAAPAVGRSTASILNASVTTSSNTSTSTTSTTTIASAATTDLNSPETISRILAKLPKRPEILDFSELTGAELKALSTSALGPLVGAERRSAPLGHDGEVGFDAHERAELAAAYLARAA